MTLSGKLVFTIIPI